MRTDIQNEETTEGCREHEEKKMMTYDDNAHTTALLAAKGKSKDRRVRSCAILSRLYSTFFAASSRPISGMFFARPVGFSYW